MYELTDKLANTFRESRKARIDAGRSQVQKPAAPTKAVAFKALGSDEFGVIVGIGGAAGSPTKPDLDNEFVSKADLQKMAFDFCGSPNRKFKANHEEDIEVRLCGSWVGAPIIAVTAKADGASTTRVLGEHEELTRDMKVVGISTEKGHETHWFVAVKPTDPAIVEIAKSGGIAGFSWSGLVNKTEVE